MKIQAVRLHPRGHSHNDEMQARPLETALEAGFTSIEVDTHLIEGELLVGHTPLDALEKKLPLEQTYLVPLLKRFQEYGAIYAEGPAVNLVLDLKTEGERTYAALKPLLGKYRSMLARVENGRKVPGAVNVVLTGDKPRVAGGDRDVFLDGSIRQLDDPVDTSLTPTVSGNFRAYFLWNGKGEMPAHERSRLDRLVEKAHEDGVELRFWQAPDHPDTWKTLYDAGVDRINTDRPAAFAAWDEATHS